MAKPVSPKQTRNGYATDTDLAARFRVSRTTIWRWANTIEDFPQPVKLTGGTTRWKLDDLEAWEKSQATAA